MRSKELNAKNPTLEKPELKDLVSIETLSSESRGESSRDFIDLNQTIRETNMANQIVLLL